MVKLRIFIADGNFLSRSGLTSLIGDLKNYAVCGIAENADAFSNTLFNSHPDLLIIDHTSSGFSMEQVSEVKNIYPGLPVLVISAREQKEEMIKVLDSGVTGYVLKECGREEIIEAMASVLIGEKFFCNKILEFLVDQNRDRSCCTGKNCENCDPVRVTDREIEIIKLIAGGYTNKEIAAKLYLSSHTVHTHRKNIMSKIGVNNTAGIVMYAVRENLLDSNRLQVSTAN
ncbi:MAG: response regulator transcription factor [Bacteroidetes bacterium]|nr:response regulator transcription factor [Bacteroidota bacterium]